MGAVSDFTRRFQGRGGDPRLTEAHGGEEVEAREDVALEEFCYKGEQRKREMAGRDVGLRRVFIFIHSFFFFNGWKDTAHLSACGDNPGVRESVWMLGDREQWKEQILGQKGP